MHPIDYISLLMAAVFVVGYLFITLEHLTYINKATIALLMAVLCWSIQFLDPSWSWERNHQVLEEHLSSISQVVIFLLGALAIVEIISVHKGFNLVTKALHFQSKRKTLWVVGLITFFLSAVLDNLTTTVVMLSMLRKVVDEGEDRLFTGGAIVIAANAGGAWTPIGDVTTTMLWIGGQVSTLTVMRDLFLPSFVCLLVALLLLSIPLKGNYHLRELSAEDDALEPMGEFVFFLGVAALVFVPFFKILTGLPPFMGMLLGLSVMWLITDLVHHKDYSRDHLKVPQVLARIDLAGVLFFLGILLAIQALEAAQILGHLSIWFDKHISNPQWLATVIGFVSAVVDNVPLVAATMEMYTLEQFPTDHSFWQLVAYCAGTGGSMLLIGSAAGIVFMGLEKVDFFWYMRRISLPALLSYAAGIAVYLLMK
ncbi:MAG: sodium:proton antiporter NhaD [Parachlamydia sp.]|nr:sodium:proton antiporter NhaD [Parachlamydia sp.]